MTTAYDDLVGDLSEQFERVLPDVVPGRTVHVDGDILAYNCAGNDDVPAPIARRNLLSRIDNLKMLAGAEKIVVHLTDPRSDKGNRFEIAKTAPYQGQRTHSRRPKNWAYLREVMDGFAAAGHPEFSSHLDREADDAMSLASWQASRVGNSESVVISSADKDLRQVPGPYVDWKTGELLVRRHNVDTTADPEGSTLKQGIWFNGVWFLLFQMLYGDGTDNIPGIERVDGEWLLKNLPAEVNAKVRAGKEAPKDKPCGPALAAKILLSVSKPSAAYTLVKDLYALRFKDRSRWAPDDWADYFREQWQLLCLYYYDNDQRLQLARDIRDGKFDN